MGNYDDEQNADYEDEAHTLTYGCIMAPNRCTKRFLNISDTLIALFVVTPLVIGQWYGSWEFMNNHAEYFPIVPTFLFGLSYHLLMVWSRHRVHEKVKTPHQRQLSLARRIARYIFTKAYIYFFSIATLMVFRAIFLFCEPYGKLNHLNRPHQSPIIRDLHVFNKRCLAFVDIGYVPSISIFVVSAAALVCFKSLRNIIGPPFVIVTDCKEISFAFPTRYKSHVSTLTILFYLPPKTCKTVALCWCQVFCFWI